MRDRSHHRGGPAEPRRGEQPASQSDGEPPGTGTRELLPALEPQFRLGEAVHHHHPLRHRHVGGWRVRRCRCAPPGEECRRQHGRIDRALGDAAAHRPGEEAAQAGAGGEREVPPQVRPPLPRQRRLHRHRDRLALALHHQVGGQRRGDLARAIRPAACRPAPARAEARDRRARRQAGGRDRRLVEPGGAARLAGCPVVERRQPGGGEDVAGGAQALVVEPELIERAGEHDAAAAQGLLGLVEEGAVARRRRGRQAAFVDRAQQPASHRTRDRAAVGEVVEAVRAAPAPRPSRGRGADCGSGREAGRAGRVRPPRRSPPRESGSRSGCDPARATRRPGRVPRGARRRCRG